MTRIPYADIRLSAELALQHRRLEANVRAAIRSVLAWLDALEAEPIYQYTPPVLPPYTSGQMDVDPDPAIYPMLASEATLAKEWDDDIEYTWDTDIGWVGAAE